MASNINIQYIFLQLAQKLGFTLDINKPVKCWYPEDESTDENQYTNISDVSITFNIYTKLCHFPNKILIGLELNLFL